MDKCDKQILGTPTLGLGFTPNETFVPSILEGGTLTNRSNSLNACDGSIKLEDGWEYWKMSGPVWHRGCLFLIHQQELKYCIGHEVTVHVNPNRLSTLSALSEDDFTYSTWEPIKIEDWLAITVTDLETYKSYSLDGLLMYYKLRHLLQRRDKDLQVAVVKFLDDLIRLHSTRHKSNDVVKRLQFVQRLATVSADNAQELVNHLLNGNLPFKELGLILTETLESLQLLYEQSQQRRIETS